MRLRLPDHEVNYQVLRSNTKWPDHMLRTQVTAGVISWFHPDSILDPACGDGSIVMAAHRARTIITGYLADISEPSIESLREVREKTDYLPGVTTLCVGNLLDTLNDDSLFVDLVVLTEIIEHVDDPDLVVRLARRRGRSLVASSPRMVEGGRIDDNPEHKWQFDEDGYRKLLLDNGWDPTCCIIQTQPGGWYDFQVWGAT